MLPLVLTMPFYVLLIAMIIECTLMLTAKIGSVGAAYAAGRSAAVQLSYENAMPKDAPDYTPLEQRKAMVHLAAARAMWAYASGAKSQASGGPLGEFVDASIKQQVAAFQKYSGDEDFDSEYLKRKFAYAFNALTITIDYLDPISGAPYEKSEAPAFNAKIQLTLEYEAPIHTYGIGRLFGKRSQFGGHFVRPIITVVTIENEGVKKLSNEESQNSTAKLINSLGIRYYKTKLPSISQSTESRPVVGQSDFTHSVHHDNIDVDGVSVPVFIVDHNSVSKSGANKEVAAARYSYGVIYLRKGEWKFYNLDHEVQHAKDDIRDKKIDNKFTDEFGRTLNYLQTEIRGAQASIDSIEDTWTWLSYKFEIPVYLKRIQWMQDTDKVLQGMNNSALEELKEAEKKKLSSKNEYRNYLDNAIIDRLHPRISHVH